MKKIGIIVFIGCVSIVCVTVGMILLKKRKTPQKPTKYLIDIIIVNKENIDIDYIQMGMVLPDGDEEIINTVRGNKEYNNTYHFTISYSPDTQFFLKGKSSEKEIEPCYFDLAGYSNVYEPQQVNFYIENYKIYKE